MRKINSTVIRIPTKQSSNWSKDQVLPDQHQAKYTLAYLQHSLESLEVDLSNAIEHSAQISEKKVRPFSNQAHFLSTLSQKIKHLMISIFS